MSKHLLLTPGPTQLAEEVCAALGQPIIHHRTSQFQGILKEVTEGLREVFQTKNDVYLLASSGTGAMEAAVSNLLSAGDKAITVEGGKFGERWTEICKAYNVNTTVIQVPWGKAVTADQIQAALDKDKNIKAVFTTLCETSTGAATDIEKIAKVVGQTNAVLVVDAVSALGVVDLKTDQWQVDVVVGASHKGLMLPPGLSMLSVNAKAFALMEASTSPRYYLDLRKSKKAAAKTDTPFTPAIGIVIALKTSLDIIRNKGLKNLFKHFERLAGGTRAAAEALGLSIFTDKACRSNVLTAINLPASVNGEKLVKRMRETYGISVAGGQGDLKGKLVRIAHMGCLTEEDILAGLACFEKVLKEEGYAFTPEAGVNAAKKFFQTQKAVISKTE